MVERMERFLGRPLERLDKADAKDVEEKWAETKKLLKDGKKAEAQKVWDAIRAKLFGG